MKKPQVLLILALLLVGMTFAETRYYYVGSIGEHPIQLDLTIDGESASGSYYYERVGLPLSLSGGVRELHEITLAEHDERGLKTGRFEGALTSSFNEVGETFSGTWSSADGERTLPFTLNRVAEHVYARTRQGEMIEVTSSYPFFFHTWRFINTRLQESARYDHQEFVREGQGFALAGELFGGWWLYDDYAIGYYADDLISLLETTHSYTGGAHPNTLYAAFNFRLDGDEVVPLALHDLFSPGYLEPLSDFVMAQLRAREADWVVNGMITALDEADLHVFTLSPRGLTFAFAPYEVGSYAQGPHFVAVPYEAIGGFIDGAGPLGRFVAGGAP